MTTSAARFPLKHAYGRFIQLMFLDPERYWEPLCRNIGREDLLTNSLYCNADARVRNGAQLTDEIEAAISQQDWDHWQPIFEIWDAPRSGTQRRRVI